MTIGAAGRPASAPKRATCGSSAVVTPSVTPAVVSVLAVTRPRPGKCLRAAVTRWAPSPSTTVPAAAPTCCGVLPYWRSKKPIGALACSVPAGTTSATGARSSVTPALCSDAPIPSARAASCCGGSRPWSRAEGSSPKPGPFKVCTWPPSWSAATQGRGPGASVAQRPVTVPRSPVDAVERPARNTPPTPCCTRASPEARPVSGTPTTNSWATRCRGSIRDSAASTAASPAGAVVVVGADADDEAAEDDGWLGRPPDVLAVEDREECPPQEASSSGSTAHSTTTAARTGRRIELLANRRRGTRGDLQCAAPGGPRGSPDLRAAVVGRSHPRECCCHTTVCGIRGAPCPACPCPSGCSSSSPRPAAADLPGRLAGPRPGGRTGRRGARRGGGRQPAAERAGLLADRPG